MLKLKNILTEQFGITKPKILFAGDKQTLSRNSYASNLINSGNITGIIVGTSKATATDLYRSLRNKLDNTYDAAVIMMGPDQVVDRNTKTIISSMRVLNSCVRLGKAQGVPVIVISAPATNKKSKLTPEVNKEISNKIQSNTSADDIISMDVSIYDLDKKTGVLNSSVQQEIQDAVVESLNELLKIDITSPATPEDETEDETADDVVTSLANIPASASEFLNQWKDIAIQHMEKYGIPASITLAQAALESGWGKSGLTTKYNNYFGITGAYKGNSVKLKNKNGEVYTWRVYSTPEESFEDHADLLRRKYKPTKENATYKEWAETLTSRGYAESDYGAGLLKMIKRYSLDKYDTGEATVSAFDTKLKNILGSTSLSVTSRFKSADRPNHKGIDYKATVGTDIQLAQPGTVVRAGNIDPDGWGNTVEIKHADGSLTRYAHLSSINVAAGDEVEAGTVIGTTGGKKGAAGAGNSRGPHLHWEWLPDGRTQQDGENVASDYFRLS